MYWVAAKLYVLNAAHSIGADVQSTPYANTWVYVLL